MEKWVWFWEMGLVLRSTSQPGFVIYVFLKKPACCQWLQRMIRVGLDVFAYSWYHTMYRERERESAQCTVITLQLVRWKHKSPNSTMSGERGPLWRRSCIDARPETPVYSPRFPVSSSVAVVRVATYQVMWFHPCLCNVDNGQLTELQAHSGVLEISETSLKQCKSYKDFLKCCANYWVSLNFVKCFVGCVPLAPALSKLEAELTRVRRELEEGKESSQMAQLSLAEKETELLQSQDTLLWVWTRSEGDRAWQKFWDVVRCWGVAQILEVWSDTVGRHGRYSFITFITRTYPELCLRPHVSDFKLILFGHFKTCPLVGDYHFWWQWIVILSKSKDFLFIFSYTFSWQWYSAVSCSCADGGGFCVAQHARQFSWERTWERMELYPQDKRGEDPAASQHGMCGWVSEITPVSCVNKWLWRWSGSSNSTTFICEMTLHIVNHIHRLHCCQEFLLIEWFYVFGRWMASTCLLVPCNDLSFAAYQ